MENPHWKYREEKNYGFEILKKKIDKINEGKNITVEDSSIELKGSFAAIEKRNEVNMEAMCCRIINGMLNSNGGVLLCYVSDDGKKNLWNDEKNGVQRVFSGRRWVVEPEKEHEHIKDMAKKVIDKGLEYLYDEFGMRDSVVLDGEDENTKSWIYLAVDANVENEQEKILRIHVRGFRVAKLKRAQKKCHYWERVGTATRPVEDVGVLMKKGLTADRETEEADGRIVNHEEADGKWKDNTFERNKNNFEECIEKIKKSYSEYMKKDKKKEEKWEHWKQSGIRRTNTEFVQQTGDALRRLRVLLSDEDFVASMQKESIHRWDKEMWSLVAMDIIDVNEVLRAGSGLKKDELRWKESMCVSKGFDNTDGAYEYQFRYKGAVIEGIPAETHYHDKGVPKHDNIKLPNGIGELWMDERVYIIGKWADGILTDVFEYGDAEWEHYADGCSEDTFWRIYKNRFYMAGEAALEAGPGGNDDGLKPLDSYRGNVRRNLYHGYGQYHHVPSGEEKKEDDAQRWLAVDGLWRKGKLDGGAKVDVGVCSAKYEEEGSGVFGRLVSEAVFVGGKIDKGEARKFTLFFYDASVLEKSGWDVMDALHIFRSGDFDWSKTPYLIKKEFGCDKNGEIFYYAQAPDKVPLRKEEYPDGVIIETDEDILSVSSRFGISWEVIKDGKGMSVDLIEEVEVFVNRQSRKILDLIGDDRSSNSSYNGPTTKSGEAFLTNHKNKCDFWKRFTWDS